VTFCRVETRINLVTSCERANSHFSMSAFATVERRRREELLAIQKQDRDRQQAQTTDEPVVVEPPAEQQ
jgi:hypothetical protein